MSETLYFKRPGSEKSIKLKSIVPENAIKENFLEINYEGKEMEEGIAGIKINRGRESPFLIEFSETNKELKFGLEGNLKTFVSKEYVDSLGWYLDSNGRLIFRKKKGDE